MDIKELRVGNYIQNCFGHTGIVKSLSDKYIVCKMPLSTHKSAPSEFAPEKLTEEWLLKFGFEKRDKENYDIRDFRYNTFNKQVYVCYEQITNIDILYIHQLQNLYFALTGKELEQRSQTGDK